ncbi:MAG: nucleotidyltransferase family protein [Desulfobacterales bacterium]|nr:nucleotidyltransferase family protein [Desulfobacterales bacterium]
MKVVILCAGYATRMYPLTKNFPKPLLKIADRPVLDYLIDQIIDLPLIESIHIVSNARFYDHFVHWQSDHDKRGTFGKITVRLHSDGSTENTNRLGAIADLQLALKSFDTPGRVLVSGGDNIYRFPLKPLWETFLQNKHHYVVGIAEKKEENLKNTGILEFNESGRVLRLHEKPDQPISNWICPPLYFFQPSVWPQLDNFLATSGNGDAPGYFIDYLCQHEPVEAYQLNSSRLDIGSLEAYLQADQQMRQELV